MLLAIGAPARGGEVDQLDSLVNHKLFGGKFSYGRTLRTFHGLCPLMLRMLSCNVAGVLITV
jgi:hypothetical protein